MFKKFLATILLVGAIFATVPVQAESDFDLNKDFQSKLQPVTYIYSGRVVGISTYLSVRERPSVNSREIMRIPNGTELYLRFHDNDWFQVLKINGNDYGIEPGYCIGYVSSRYVRTY